MTYKFNPGDKVWVKARVMLERSTIGNTHVDIDGVRVVTVSQNLRPRIKRTPPESQWQPMRTAPMDGTEILGLWSKPSEREVLLISWQGGEWMATASFAPLRSEPTHWAPIPALPENAK